MGWRYLVRKVGTKELDADLRNESNADRRRRVVAWNECFRPGMIYLWR
jgi:hypothetical protein